MNAVKAAEVKAFALSHLADHFVENNFATSDITDDFDLMKKGIIDSIGLIQLVSAIEEHFNIEVDFGDMDTENITVIGPLCKYIEERAVSKSS